jgi:hypothetical protein
MGMQLTGCYYDNQADLHPGNSSLTCDTSDYTFSGKVTAILRTNCYSCHTQSFAAGNISLDNYAGVKIVADNGKLRGSLNHQAGFVPMPQNQPKLSDCDLLIITKWLENGSTSN